MPLYNPAGGGGAPSGAAGGDLAGSTYPNPTIAAAAVTLAKQSNAAANSLRGNNTGSPATPLDLTVAQAKTLLATSLTSDVTGTLQAAQMPALTGEVALTAGTLALRRDRGFLPVDNNLKAANGDPAIFSGAGTLLGASTHYTFRVFLRGGDVITNYRWVISTIGASLAANLYAWALFNCDATGTLVASSGTADAATAWGTAGVASLALTSPYTVAADGYYLIGMQSGTATTQPKMPISGITNMVNAGLTIGSGVAPNSALCPRWGLATNSFTGLTPPSTTGNITTTGTPITAWVGLS